jgi:hypothetical protein
MKRLTVRVACVLAAAALFALAMPAIAGAVYVTNADCLGCHAPARSGAITKTDFTTAAGSGNVDYNKCKACHWIGMGDWINGYDHGHGARKRSYACATSGCHPTYQDADLLCLPTTWTSYGYFSSATSPLKGSTVIHAKHVNGSWPRSGVYVPNYCSSCHEAAACTACHTGTVAHGSHSGTATISYMTGSGTPDLYPFVVSTVPYSSTCTNIACHAPVAAGSDGFTPACVSCHSTKTGEHGYGSVSHVASDAAEPGTAILCSACHSLDLMPEHAKATSNGPKDCLTCHPVPYDTTAKPFVWNKGCDQCHGVGATPAKHGSMETTHAAARSADCFACHIGSLPVVHTDATTTVGAAVVGSCLVCHNPVSSPALAGKTCVTCHSAYQDVKNHYDALKHASTWSLGSSCAGAGCHDEGVTDLDLVHNRFRTNASGLPPFACVDCHTSTRTEVGVAIKAGQTACVACHAGATQTRNHVALHVADPPALKAGCLECHATNLVDEHMGTKPRTTSAGVPLTCASCHASTDTLVSGAIALRKSNCADCHVAHRPIADVHASTYAVTQAVPCADCHVADIVTVHASVTTTVSGVALTGCAVCHDNFDGARGTTVQSAIDSKNTLCTACHPADHVDLGGHVASASPKCAGCHAVGDVRPLHATPGCPVCHANTDTNRVGPITGKTAECVSCHSNIDTSLAAHTDYTSKHVSSQTACAGSGCHAIGDLAALHVNATTTVNAVVVSSCRVCHKSPTDKPTSQDCRTCHLTDGTDYHTHMTAVHTSPTLSDCFQSGCHDVSKSLPAVHEPFVGDGKPYATTCDLCHKNTAGRIDWTRADATCTGVCHDPQTTHSGVTHTASAAKSQDCLVCHTAGGVPEIHGAEYYVTAKHPKCATCHNRPNGVGDITYEHTTSDCDNCHAYWPPDATHYSETSHTVNAGGDCGACHLPAMKAEHGKPSVWPVTNCVSCHISAKFTSLTGPWQHTCAECHATTHGEKASKHATKNSTACAGSGCHAIGDVAVDHVNATKTVDGVLYTNCYVCHDDPAAVPSSVECADCHPTSTIHLAAVAKHKSTNTTCAGAGCHDVTRVDVIHNTPTSVLKCAACHKPNAVLTTNCTAAGCHATVGTSHHALHDASATIDPGCKGCHSTFLDTEHSLLGKTCATCHDSTNTAVKTAITAGTRACVACHPTTDITNKHNAQATNEFIGGNQSVHRVYSTLPSPRTSFYINGAVRTWTLPADSAYLKTGWTSTSVVTCDQCHTFSSTAAGPHGATVGVNLDPGYPTDWTTVYLGSSGSHTSSTSGASSDTFICAKCHTDFGSMNGVHADSNHSGSTDGRCIGCHTKVPHGWRLPRLLAYTSDPMPYSSLNLTGISVKNRTPTSGWSVSDCSQSGCSEHNSSMSNRWPSTTVAYGTITGKVTDVLGTVAGATVTNDRGQSATTDATGTYTFTSVPAGTTAVNVTVVKAGYITQTKPAATFTDGQTVALDFKLAKLGSIAGVVTSGGSPLSGVTVSITGGSTTTDVNGAYTLPGLAAGTYTVTFAKTGYTTATKVGVVVANDTVANGNFTLVPWVNLALGKTWTASRFQGSPNTTYAPAKAGDANLTTYWLSSSTGGSTTSEWLTVDLGSSQAVSKVEVVWFAALWAHEFRISTSTDNSHWSSVYSTTGGAGASMLCTFNSRSARYIRLECNRTSGTNTGYGVAEMRVFQ